MSPGKVLYSLINGICIGLGGIAILLVLWIDIYLICRTQNMYIIMYIANTPACAYNPYMAAW